MVAKCLVGACIAILCAAPVLGEEGKGAQGIQLAKFVEPSPPLPKLNEAQPDVKVKENFEYYEVDGTTTAELRSQMKRNGTAWDDGKVYAALTTWDVHYHYDITSSNGAYVLSAIKTDVDIVFHLPRLVPSTKTPPQLVLTWNSYVEHLKTHEFGHRDLAVGIGREIYQALSALGSSSSKSELDHEALNLIQAKFKKLKEVQIEYDQETHHGKKQGAILTDSMLAAGSPEN